MSSSSTSINTNGTMPTVAPSAPTGTASGTVSATASGGLGTVSVIAPVAAPLYCWQFQDTLTDSFGGNTLSLTGGGISYATNPWGAAKLHKSLKTTADDINPSSPTSCRLAASLTGSPFDAFNYATLSWSACYWLRSPGAGTSLNTPSGTNYAWLEIRLLNTRLYISRLLNASFPQYEFLQSYVTSAGAETATLNTQDPDRNLQAPDWIALTYDQPTSTFKVFTASGGTVTQAYSNTLSASNYRSGFGDIVLEHYFTSSSPTDASTSVA